MMYKSTIGKAVVYAALVKLDTASAGYYSMELPECNSASKTLKVPRKWIKKEDEQQLFSMVDSLCCVGIEVKSKEGSTPLMDILDDEKRIDNKKRIKFKTVETWKELWDEVVDVEFSVLDAKANELQTDLSMQGKEYLSCIQTALGESSSYKIMEEGSVESSNGDDVLAKYLQDQESLASKSTLSITISLFVASCAYFLA